MQLKIFRVAKAYILKKDRETAAKKQKERVNGMVKGLIVGRTPKESIEMIKQVVELFNEKMDDTLKQGLTTVEVIAAYKNLK